MPCFSFQSDSWISNPLPNCCKLYGFFNLLSSSRLTRCFDKKVQKSFTFQKNKCLQPLNELWSISRLSLLHLSNGFCVAVTQPPLNNLSEATSVSFGGVKEKDAFKAPFSKKERLSSLRLSAIHISEWAEVRKCVKPCCWLFPWESELPLFQELYCERPKWWPKANEPLGYKQRVGQVFLSPVSAILAVIVFFSSLNTPFRNLPHQLSLQAIKQFNNV